MKKQLLDFLIKENQRINDNYSLLKLSPADGSRIIDTVAGQFVQVEVPDSKATFLRRPISINYEKGKPLSYYIKRAGGYANRAHKSRVYAIYMNGAVEQLDRRTSKSIQPGCEIVVPTKPQKNKMTTAEMMTIGTSTASIATMIATLVNLFK